jgi:hypothetical protein
MKYCIFIYIRTQDSDSLILRPFWSVAGQKCWNVSPWSIRENTMHNQRGKYVVLSNSGIVRRFLILFELPIRRPGKCITWMRPLRLSSSISEAYRAILDNTDRYIEFSLGVQIRMIAIFSHSQHTISNWMRENIVFQYSGSIWDINTRWMSHFVGRPAIWR